LKNVS